MVCIGLVFQARAQENKEWRITAYGDLFYTHSFNHPDRGVGMFGRTFDTVQGEVRLAAANVSFEYKPTASLVSFFGSVWVGENAEILNATEPAGGDFAKHVPEAYVTYKKDQLTLQAGKFYSWLGYEVMDSEGNDNYSGGLLFTFAEPSYHTGVHVNYEFDAMTNASFYGVLGWNELKDANDDLAFGAAVRHTTNDGVSIVGNVYFGREGSDTPNRSGSFGGVGFADPGRSEVSLFNVNASKQVTPKLKLGISVDYATARGDAARGEWYGAAVYATHTIDPKSTLALRLESFTDEAGLRTPAPASISSIALTYNYAIHQNATLRGELRHDWSNNPFFPDSSGVRKQQTNFTIAAHVHF